jgi:TonB family protein
MRSHLSIAAVTAFLILAFGQLGTLAQAPKLSLADLLIGLRSQKVSLPERNAILTEAVKQRGVTFTFSSEIEKELATTGAGPELLAALREIAAPKPEPKPVATPIPTPTPPDWSYYAKRAESNATKGDFTLALADYNKAAEMESAEMSVFVGRAKTHYNLKSYDKALSDYDRVVELAPKDPAAYYYRAMTYERAGKPDKALADYLQASTLDPKNEAAAASVKRLQDEIAKAQEAARPKPEPVKVERPEFVNLGTISQAHAERFVMPTYPQLAFRSSIEGRVVVEVELDEEGKVVSANATSGHQMLRQAAEDAAKRSRFKPAMFESTPIKAKAVVVYSFTLKGSDE